MEHAPAVAWGHYDARIATPDGVWWHASVSQNVVMFTNETDDLMYVEGLGEFGSPAAKPVAATSQFPTYFRVPVNSSWVNRFVHEKIGAGMNVKAANLNQQYIRFVPHDDGPMDFLAHDFGHIPNNITPLSFVKSATGASPVTLAVGDWYSEQIVGVTVPPGTPMWTPTTVLDERFEPSWCCVG